MARITTACMVWAPKGTPVTLPEWNGKRLAWREQGNRSREAFAKDLHAERYACWQRQQGRHATKENPGLYQKWATLPNNLRALYLDHCDRPSTGTVQTAGAPVIEYVDDQGNVLAMDLYQPTAQELFRVDWERA